MERIYELDLLRGIMITAVVIYHTLFDLQYFLGIDTGCLTPSAKMAVFLMSGTLIAVSGASAVLGRRTLKRGLTVLALGCLITLTTYLINRQEYVTFGILSLLGCCMVVAYAVKIINPPLSAITAAALASIFAGVYFYFIRVNTPYLFWIGLINDSYRSLDHYPLFPWLGVFLGGFCFGRMYYMDRTSPFTHGFYSQNPFTWAGRHSLAIYLAHQPVVLAVMWAVSKVMG